MWFYVLYKCCDSGSDGPAINNDPVCFRELSKLWDGGHRDLWRRNAYLHSSAGFSLCSC